MSQPQIEKFHLGDILSITTGLILSPTHLDGIYRILNFLTGTTLYTPEIPRATDECRPWLLQQFPQLRNVNVSDVNADNCAQVVAELVSEFGEFHSVQRMPPKEVT